jgi:hypothetical protein
MFIRLMSAMAPFAQHTAVCVGAGLLAGLLSIVGTAPYLRDVRRGRTRPHRGTWGIWTMVGVVAAAANIADGLTWSLVQICIQALTSAVVLGLAVRSGVGSLTPGNAVMLAVAVAGVVAWAVSSDPTTAVVGMVVADGIGVAVMLPKTWRDPHSETVATFELATVSGLLGMVAVGGIDPGSLAWPGYLMTANGLTAGVIVARRLALRPTPAPSPIG